MISIDIVVSRSRPTLAQPPPSYGSISEDSPLQRNNSSRTLFRIPLVTSFISFVLGGLVVSSISIANVLVRQPIIVEALSLVLPTIFFATITLVTAYASQRGNATAQHATGVVMACAAFGMVVVGIMWGAKVADFKLQPAVIESITLGLPTIFFAFVAIAAGCVTQRGNEAMQNAAGLVMAGAAFGMVIVGIMWGAKVTRSNTGT